MRREAILLPILCSAFAPAMAQFDLGISTGAVHNSLWVPPIDDPHASAWVGNVTGFTWSSSIFYRERYSSFVDLGVDLTLAHRSFSAGFRGGGLGSGFTSNAHVDMDQLYIGVKPEVHTDAKGFCVVRFGLMAGISSWGHAPGSTSGWSVAGPGTYKPSADLIHKFGGDLRFAFGLGLRFAAGTQWAITIDPESTFGLSSMLFDEARIRGSDIGLRVGLCRRFKGKALTELFKVPPRDPKAGAEW